MRRRRRERRGEEQEDPGTIWKKKKGKPIGSKAEQTSLISYKNKNVRIKTIYWLLLFELICVNF